jgi:hypothetical protein
MATVTKEVELQQTDVLTEANAIGTWPACFGLLRPVFNVSLMLGTTFGFHGLIPHVTNTASGNTTSYKRR